MEKGDYSKV